MSKTGVSLIGKKILLVDDEQDVLSVLKSALEHWQAKVDAFLKPKDALEAFAKQPDDFAIVVTDIRMSVMTGFELASKIRTLRPKMPIIFISAHDIQRASDLAKDSTAFSNEDIIKKPFDVSSLGEAILKKIENASGSK